MFCDLELQRTPNATGFKFDGGPNTGGCSFMSINVYLTALVNGILNGGVYSLASVGLTLIFGVMGIANFAHGALIMTGMYVSFWLFKLCGIDPFIGLLPAMAFMFIVGWLLQKYILCTLIDAPHFNGFLLTIGLGLFITNLAYFLWPDHKQLQVSYQNAAIPLTSELNVEVVRLGAFLVACVLALLLYYFLKKTDLGKAIRGTAQNKLGAQISGINVTKIYCLTFAIGAACSGAAGAVIAPFYPVSNDAGDYFSLLAFVVVCLGGMGNPNGALLGGLIIGLAESLGSVFIPGGQKEIVIYMIFLLILLVKPTGLFKSSGYWQAHS
jgi:branched-chain amino acid transport system permease protein